MIPFEKIRNTRNVDCSANPVIILKTIESLDHIKIVVCYKIKADQNRINHSWSPLCASTKDLA